MVVDYIDSNIILEILLEGKNKDICEGYLYSLIKYKSVIGVISFLTLGEITYAINNKISNYEKRSFVYNKLLDKLKHLKLIGFSIRTFEIVLDLTDMDYKLSEEPADALHLSIAISKKANRFVTLEDKKFSQELKSYVKQKGTKIVTLTSKINKT